MSGNAANTTPSPRLEMVEAVHSRVKRESIAAPYDPGLSVVSHLLGSGAILEYQTPPKTADEKEPLVAFLNNQRAILAWKLDGLSQEEAVRPMVSSGTSLLGVVSHMATVELYWFGEIAAEGAYELPEEMAKWFERIRGRWESGQDDDAEFRVDAGETVEEIVGYYETAIGIANAIIEAHDLDHVGARDMHLRWILVHMIEETARHAGHADIVRELIDDTTGYLPD